MVDAKEPSTIAIGKLIHKLREQSGLSQEEFASEAGLEDVENEILKYNS